MYSREKGNVKCLRCIAGSTRIVIVEYNDLRLRCVVDDLRLRCITFILALYILESPVSYLELRVLRTMTNPNELFSSGT